MRFDFQIGVFRQVACVALVSLLGLSACASDRPETPVVSTRYPCPDWAAFPADHHSNAGSPYLGCANTVNLQTMVEQPSDLDAGRPLGAASGERETLGVRAYELGKVKPFPNANAPAPLSVSVTPSTTGGTSQ